MHQRDHIGVQDSVLLENHESEDSFLENLRKRFKANLIYVSLPVFPCASLGLGAGVFIQTAVV